MRALAFSSATRSFSLCGLTERVRQKQPERQFSQPFQADFGAAITRNAARVTFSTRDAIVDFLIGSTVNRIVNNMNKNQGPSLGEPRVFATGLPSAEPVR